jgi:ADP-ribose pyrophosphatase YjhB (NUDIX family)
MKYKSTLSKTEREKIFALFLHSNRLKFNQIEKSLGARSNIVAYHLEQMQKEKLLEKRGEYYYLTKHAEKYLPIFSHLVGEELSPLPVVLIAIRHQNKILLIKRNKRPYKDYWAMVGGKVLLEESIEHACLRLVKEKTGLDGTFVSTNAIVHEKVEGDGMIKHAFILLFATVKVSSIKCKESAEGTLKWFLLVKDHKNDIVPSDAWLIKHQLSSKIKIHHVHMHEKDGELTSFEIK